ncbi:MAG: helix-turn-helix domain-containing protein [Cyclobacteriaceae bacterium]
MKYEEYIITQKPLSHYALCVWMLDDKQGVQTFRHIPKCQSMLIFSFNGTTEISVSGQFLKLPDTFLIPIFNSSQEVRIAATHLIGISFLKDGLFRLVQNDLDAIGFQIPIEKAPVIDRLRQLITSQSFDTVASVIQEYLTKNMMLDQDLSGVEKAIDRIENSKGCLSISHICRDVGISERSLQRHFKSRIGISPKKFSKITRVNAYLEELLAKESSDWMQTVVSFNYHDQPHLINEFKSIIRLSPRDLLKLKDSLYQQVS